MNLKRLAKRALATLSLSMLCLVAFAQGHQVTGTVIDGTGEPIIGANVLEVGTTNGVITDIDGNFKLNVQPNAKLQVSFIGYISQTIAVGNQKEFKIILKDDSKALDEVVVIGYGTVKKRDLTGSVASVNNETLTANPVSDVAQALQGRLPGVSVMSQDGRPDAEVSIRVRGGGSVTQSNDPLFVVDGFPVSSISDIPADQIESIDVLKDASSTAIYGARGANGVILITTKGAKTDKISVTYNGYVQTKKAANTLDVLNAQQYMEYWWGYNTGYGTSYADGFAKYYGLGSKYGNHYNDYANVDVHNYTDDIYRSAFSHNHNINISGGSEKTKVAFNANYLNDQGIKINSGLDRANFSLKLQQEILKNLKVDFDIRYVETKINGVEDNAVNGRGSLTSSAYMYLPIDNPLGGVDYTEASGGFGNGDIFIDKSKGTPVELINDITNKTNRQNFRTTAAVTWDIIKGLSLRSEFGFSRGHNQTNYYEDGLTNSYKYAKITKGDSKDLRSVTTLNYEVKGLGENNKLSFLLGNEFLKSESNSSWMSGKGYPDSFDYNKTIGLINMWQTEGLFQNTLGTPSKTVSFFARGNYSLLDRYLFTATFRADGSSKFAPNHRWGYFPAGAFAWRISDEPFMANTKKWLDNLKLRLSFGTAGSDNISPSLWKETWIASTESINGENVTVFKPEGLYPNENLKWETTISRNLGLDFGFWNNRLYGTIDLYWNTTKDLLMCVPIDETTGYSYQYDNIGKTSNKGIELSLGADIVRTKDFKLSISATYNYNKNNIDELSEGITTSYGSGWASSDTSPIYDYTFSVGKPVGLIRAYASDGFYKVNDFNYDSATGTYTLKNGVTDMPSVDKGYGTYPNPFKIADGQQAFPGAMKLRDADGDGNADLEEFEVNPKHTGGFNINATYKNFDLNAAFSWTAGGHVYNVASLLNMYGNGNGSIGANRLAVVNDCFKYYQVDNNGELQAVTDPTALESLNANAKYYSPYAQKGIATSDFIESNSFLRLQSLTIGYSLPKSLISKIGMQRCRLYATGGNLFTITGYKGLDPEVNAVTDRNGASSNAQKFPTLGLDFGTYPRARTFTFGVNIEF